MVKRTREFLKSRRKNQRKLGHIINKYRRELDKSFENLLLYGIDMTEVDASSRLKENIKIHNKTPKFNLD